MVQVHQSNLQAEAAASDQLAEAMNGQQWMSVVFSVKDGKIQMGETTCNFPNSVQVHEECQLLLKKALLRKRMDVGADRSPLPLAAHLIEDGKKITIADAAPVTVLPSVTEGTTDVQITE